MECVNPNCKNRERLKKLFSIEERSEFQFCPFCQAPLRIQAADESKNDLQQTQASPEATVDITKEESAIKTKEQSEDALTEKTNTEDTVCQTDCKNEPSPCSYSSNDNQLSVEHTADGPNISSVPTKTGLSDVDKSNVVHHELTKADVANPPVDQETLSHPTSAQQTGDQSQICPATTQSGARNVHEYAHDAEKETVHSREHQDAGTLNEKFASAEQNLASDFNNIHISNALGNEHTNLPSAQHNDDTSYITTEESLSLGVEKSPLHSTAVQHLSHGPTGKSAENKSSIGLEGALDRGLEATSKQDPPEKMAISDQSTGKQETTYNSELTITVASKSVASKKESKTDQTVNPPSSDSSLKHAGHAESLNSQRPSILDSGCVFGPDSQTFSQLGHDEQRDIEKQKMTSIATTHPLQKDVIMVEAHLESANSPSVHAVSDGSDTPSSCEDDTNEFQASANVGPQPYDIKQKRKERKSKRKRNASRAPSKKSKDEVAIESMDVNEANISGAQKPKKYKPNEESNFSIQESEDMSKSSPSSVGANAKPKAFVHEAVTPVTTSSSGSSNTKSAPDQKASHHPESTSEKNVSSSTNDSRSADASDITDEASKSHSQSTIQRVSSPTKTNVMGDEDLATIVFHAILSPDFHFNPEHQQVTVLLGHEELGKWNTMYTVFDTEKLKNKCVKVTGRLHIPVRLLRYPIPYKYVLVDKYGVIWEYSEFSDDYTDQIVNRSLHLMEKWKQKNVTWYQYDGIVYPRPPKESMFKFWRRGKYVQFDYAVLAKNRRDAANFFLPKWKGFAQGGTEQMSALEAIDRTKHLKECMKHPHIFTSVEMKKTIDYRDFDIEKIIAEFLKPKLSYNAHLKDEDLKNRSVRINRLISSLAITYLIWYFKLDLLYVELTGIINCLVLGATSPNRCDFDDIHMEFPESTWDDFSEAIIHLLNSANKKANGLYCPDIILAVPILHFFRHDLRPFEVPDLGDEISVEKWCHLKGFPNYRSNERVAGTYLQKSVPMFSMDPYFRRFFLCRVPIEDFFKVVSNEVFPFHELFKVLGFKIRASNLPSYSKPEVIEDCLAKMTKRMKAKLESHQLKGAEMLCLSETAKFLIEELYKKGVKASENLSLGTIKLMSIVLWGIDQQVESGENQPNEIQVYNEKSVAIFHTLLSEVEKAVEKELSYQMPYYFDGQKNEIKVWSRLLDSKFLKDEHSTKWNNVLLSHFKRRLKKLTTAVAIELFCKVEKTDGINPHLEEAITDHAFVEVEKIVESEASEHSITLLRDNLHYGVVSSRAGELLSRIVVTARNKTLSSSDGNPQAELLFILKWKPLPGFISSFGSSGNQKMLSPGAAELVQHVMAHIHSIQQSIRDRSVDVQTTILLTQHKDTFQNLCIALTKIKDVEQSPAFMKVEIVMKELQKRIEELELFQEFCDHIHNLLNMCQSCKEAIFDTNQLQQRSDTNVSEIKLKDICHRDPEEDGGEVAITFFDLPDTLCSMLPQLTSVHKSLIFQNFWKKYSRSLYREKQSDGLEDESLTLVEIHKKVLGPSLESWQQLSKKLFDATITLSEVDKHFKLFQTKEDLQRELDIMFGSFRISKTETSKMKMRLKQIEQYKSLQQYIEAAETIWNFKEALSLKGDFEIVKDLRNQTSQEFKDKTLSSIDGKFVVAAQFLHSISIEKSRCLQAVIDCEPLVKWLRETIQDTSALSTLVDLAMISAGENDMEVDRISNFHTSCLNFAPLVFDVNENLGFDDLMKVCQPVWNAVDADKHLPEKLSETNRHLEWLKAVQSSHGSVEMSSLMQTKHINLYGVYTIGNISTSSNDNFGLESVLRLNVPMDERVQGPRRIDDQYHGDDREESKTYSLNDLKTLQSKLMLIAGKTVKLRQKDSMESTEEINRFVEIFEGVMRLGQVYIDLREAGDVMYLDWQEEVNCGEDAQLIITHRHVGKKLSETCCEMEERLKNWQHYVHDRRHRFQVLNHFTTKQILGLRRELGALRGAGATLEILPLYVYALLENILSGVTNHDLLKTLNTIPGFSLEAVSTEADEQISQDRMELDSSDAKSNYDSLFSNLEKMDFGEDVGIAALKELKVVQGQTFNETDLLDWCMENGDDEDKIAELVEQAREDPNYINFFPELKEETTEKEELDHDTEILTSAEEHQIEDLPELDVTHKSYLTLDELGNVLSQLEVMGARPKERRFPDYLKRDQPNLVLVQSNDILTTVLTLYKQYGEESLPTSNEVLLCTSETTAEEVELFWWRAFQDVHKQIFCLVNPDVLDYSVSQRSVNMFNVLQKQFGTSEERRIVVICSTENEDRSHIIAAFDEYRVQATPSCATENILKSYLADQLTCPRARIGHYKDTEIDWHPASFLDTDKRSVRVISSDRAGVGKTLVVSRLDEKLIRLPNNIQMSKLKRPPAQLSVVVPLHGTVADTQQILNALWQHPVDSNLPVSRIVHIDVSPSISEGLETVLFNLVVLGVLQDKNGRLWRRRSSDLYVIEMTNHQAKDSGNTNKISFVFLLPKIDCITPIETLQQLKAKEAKSSPSPLFDLQEFSSVPVQRAFQYLLQCDREQSLDRYQYDPRRQMGTPFECLALIIKYCGIKDPSWCELKHFIDFLNSQLHDSEESYFTNAANIDDQWMQGTMRGFKSFVVKFLVTMSRDFATPSLDDNPSVVCSAGLSGQTDIDEDIRPLQLRRRWESSPHPYIFFNQDRITMTFLGFHVNATGDLIDPDTSIVIERGLMTKQLQQGLALQKVDFNTNYNNWTKLQRIEKLCMVMGLNKVFDPDSSYELTIDNMKKILAIHMRFRCGIPVVIMGETGCGKTRLIRYMCALQAGSPGQRNMLLMKVHGGTSYDDITRKVEQAEQMAETNEKQGIDTVLFFDEANTTDALGMIKEVMVDRRINGRPVGVGLRRLHFIAACNPYRRHTDKMIDKLESAGLGYSVKANETKDKLGKIPLRHLVYRVHALPASMRPLVWDFGQLKPEIEELYINQIVSRYVINERAIPGNDGLVRAIARVLAAAQKFMRKQQDECSFVSLRDVERAMTVMKWFYQHRDHLRPAIPQADDSDEEEEIAEQGQGMDMITWSLLMSLGVCYHAKLQDRKPFRDSMIRACRMPLKPTGGEQEMLNEIDRCQKVLIDELFNLGPNIARNTALSENVFMMVVCIELRIPLFVIGKPGSSKSLAKTVVADNMQGDASKSDLFKRFKRAHMVSYQCSPLSNPEGIVATFRQCRRLQENNSVDRYASVVVLDEVGLAEDSPLLPLKTLHPLLEDGVTSSDDVIETDEKPTRVAFIGISNWALDPAKMNRGLMLMRGEPDKKELVDSARGICAQRENIRTILSRLLSKLAAGYAALYKKQREFKSLGSSKRDEFFGLRDFYSLVKMVYSIAADKDGMLSWEELEHAIRRNFGGLDGFDAIQIFAEHVKSIYGGIQGGQPVKTLDLLRASLDHKNAIGESRYLLVITENYSALSIVEQELINNKDDYVVIFGSSFPKDQEYTQVCRNINQIKVCMETGRTVVLLNLESLYESLYDALNQYYVYCAGQKYVDLGLGSHRVKCRVDDTFRLIVIAEKDVVYKKFPIPLINRLEKHYLVTAKSLGPSQLGLVKDLEQWAKEFTEICQHRQTFHIGDAIIGYQSDTVPSMVLQICSRDKNPYETPGEWTQQVKRECQSLLVQCATPDAIVRLPQTSLRDRSGELRNLYFVEQEHSSLSAYLCRMFTSLNDEKEQGVLVQVSTHSRLLSENDLNDVCDATQLFRGDVKLLHLQQFQTEQQFLKQIRDFFIELGNNEGMLVVQCDSGDENFNLIACTRHLLIDQCSVKRQELLMEKLQLQADCIRAIHVVIIVQLPRLKGGCTNFVGFQGGRWKSVHIDDLRPQLLSIESSIGKPICDLLKPSWLPDTTEISEQDHDISVDDIDVEMTDETQEEEIEIDLDEDEVKPSENTIMERFDAIVLLRRSIQAAAGRLEDNRDLTKRTTDRIDLVLNLLPENSFKMPEGPSFARGLHQKIYELLKERKEKVSGDLANQWVLKEALSGTRMHERGTFRKALQCKVLSEIEPLLAKILAFADRDCNLDLLVNQSQWLIRLWLRIFKNKHMNEKYFDVSDINMIREHVNVSGRGRHVFKCRFPFSWLIKDMVDVLARGGDAQGRSSEPEVERLRGILINSELRDIFDCLSEEGQEEEAAKRYLHDFVHMVYYPTHQCQQEEIELVSRYIMMTAERENEQDGFIFDIATIHVTYNHVQTRINSFNQLVQAQPDITRLMLQQSGRMSIDVAALIAFLEMLEPNMAKLKSAEARNNWCGRVLSLRSSIEEMTSKAVFSSAYEDNEKDLLKQCWMMWQRLSVVRLFIMHVCNTSLQGKESLKYLGMIAKVFGIDTNFLAEGSVVALERFLLECSQNFTERNKICDTTCSICKSESKCPSLSPCGHCFCMDCITRWVKDNNSCPQCRQQLPAGFKPTESQEIKSSCDLLKKFRDHCNSFFMEVVSLFCFGYSPCGTLQEDTFKRLMSYVTGQEGAQTKPFSPFSDSMDVNPVVRSFLLQQLLRSSDRKVKEYMEQFIDKAKDVVEVGIDAAEVFAMSIQCMEDAHNSKLFKRTSELPLHQKLSLIESQFCKKAENTTRIPIPNALDVEWMQAIAIIRCSLTFAAELMYKVSQNDQEMLQDNVKPILKSIFDGIERVCCRPALDKPGLFLLKLLSRRFGFDSIHQVANTFNWILPEDLAGSFEVTQDQFLVYGQRYQRLRETVATSIVNGDMDVISTNIQEMTWGVNLKNVAVVLSLFHEITLNPNVPIADVVMAKLHAFIQESSDLTPWCKQLSQELISEDENYPRTITGIFALAGEDAWHTNMVKIIVHLAVVLHIRQNNGPVGPLAALAFHPDSCVNSFLPTMPDDSRQEIRDAIGGVIHECPNGHPYVITECGRPMERSQCKAPGCRAEIGGQNHNLVANNRAANTADQTRTGHCLGSPADRERTAIPERSLTPLATCLIRLLVHGSMLVGSCFNPQTVSQLISPNIQPNDVHRFLWNHLIRDMKLFSGVSGRSVDDISLIIHLLLENISIFNSMSMPSGLTVLRNKNQRKQWETFFANNIIGQVMNNLVLRMQETMRLITTDERFGSNPLLRQLYELEAGIEDPGRSITPNCAALWRYRTPITLDHVTRKFNEASDAQSKDCVILGEFLKQERELRAVKFLPDVVKLQRLLMDRYHRSLDRTETDKLTWKDFCKQIPKGSLKECKDLFQSFRSAWNIRVASIRERGIEGPLKKLAENEIRDNTPISTFIPANSGLGLLSLELTRFLVAMHNDFLEVYKRHEHVRNLPIVSVSEVTRSQLLSYDADQDLLPLVHAHCHYSLELGQGTSVEYDWPAVERHLIDRLIRGRSSVDFNEYEYTRTAVINAESVVTSLKVKIPQVELSVPIQHQIVQQYRTLQDVCDALSSVNIAITFLSSGGGRPDMSLTDYLHNVLKLPQDAGLRNHKVKEVCQLKHAVSLWRLLSIERAKRLTLNAKDPFEYLSKDFKTVIGSKLQMIVIESLRKLDEANFDSMVMRLIEVITLKLNEDIDIDNEYSLKEYFEYTSLYQDQDVSEDVKHIPGDVQLQHVYGFWQLVVDQRKKCHERRIQATG